MQVMKNIRFKDHLIIRKKDCIKLFDPTGVNPDVIIPKGEPVQMVSDPKYQLPLSVCVIWDYKLKGWRFHESCASKGMLK